MMSEPKYKVKIPLEAFTFSQEFMKHISKVIENSTDRSIIPEDVQLLTVRQVARLLNCGKSVVRQRDKLGLLPMPIRIGGTIYWNRKELTAWIDAGCPQRGEWEILKQRKDL